MQATTPRRVFAPRRCHVGWSGLGLPLRSTARRSLRPRPHPPRPKARRLLPGPFGGPLAAVSGAVCAVSAAVGAAGAGADRDHGAGGDLGVQPDPVLLEVDARRPLDGSSGSAIAMCVSTRSSVIGSSRTPGLPAPAQRLGHLARAGSRPRASGCAPGGWRGRGRRARTRSARRRTPRARPWRARSRRVRPQPRSGSMPSPRVYITVSRSGQTLSPCSQMSSAVLATTVTSASASTREPPRRCRAAGPAGSGRRPRRRRAR